MMNRNVEWARATIPEAAKLDDSELVRISRDAWKQYRVSRSVVFGVGVFLYLAFLDDRLTQAIFDNPSFGHHLIIAMVFGAVLALLLELLFRPLVRRQISKMIGTN